MKTNQRQVLETCYFIYGVVMLVAGAYARNWTVTIAMGAALLAAGIVQQWRKPGRALPPLVVPKLGRYQQYKANGGSHTAAEWRMLCELHRWRCVACGHRRPLTKDHIIPVIQGGRDDITNIQPLCRSCNSQKNGRAMVYTPVVADFTGYGKCPKCAVELGHAQWLAACRWGHCPSCKEAS